MNSSEIRQMQEQRDVRGLIAALSSASEGIRIAAVRALGAVADPAGAASLADVLRAGSTAERAWAAQALGELTEESAIDALISHGLADRKATVRNYAATALGTTGARSAVPPLCEALEDRSARVRRAAAVALVRIGDDRSETALRSYLARIGRLQRLAIQKRLEATGHELPRAGS